MDKTKSRKRRKSPRKKPYSVNLIIFLASAAGIGLLVYAFQNYNNKIIYQAPDSSIESVGESVNQNPVPVVPVVPAVAPIQKESPSDLQGVIKAAVASERGRISVMVEELYGNGDSAGVNIDRPFDPYSTYKLFIAWLVLEKIDGGLWNFTDPVRANQDIQACLGDMIIFSDNTCAESFFPMLGGRVGITDAIKAGGYSHTSFIGALRSTVSDQVLFLKKLQKGELLGSSSTEYLLNMMKNQKFRSGIPAGTKTEVADKVGFLNDDLHDSGIVYGTKGTYVISIYTKGSSWKAIARISQKVHTFLEK